MEGQFQILFDKMKIEMQNQNAELMESITTSIMGKMEEKLVPLMEENKNLKLKVEKLENEVEYLKRGEKNNNILVFGLEENESSIPDLIRRLKDKFNADLNIKIEDYEVNKIRRIGHKRKEHNKPRPVLYSLVNNWKKIEILKKKKLLKDIYITEDYSKEVLEKRKVLQAQLKEEWEKGNTAYLKYDKLIVKENTSKNTSQEKRKREFSTTPPSSENKLKKQQAMSSIKSNRSNAFDSMRIRSNSLSSTATTIKQ